MHQLVREFPVKGLATVKIDSRKNSEPVLEIILDPAFAPGSDLWDIARANPGPDNVYLRCDSHGAINNAALLCFVEVLSQWDVTDDEVPDFAHVVTAIEEAMYLSEEAPHQFARPNTRFAKIINLFMPPAPGYQIVLSFGELKPRFRWFHYVAAVPMLALLLVLIQAQIHLASWTRFSVITGANYLVEHSGLPHDVQTAVVVLFISFIVTRLFGGRRRSKKAKGSANVPFSVHTIGFFNKAAVVEEQWFREGSHKWTFGQRLRSCVAFGVVHLSNLIYPLATILPLTLGGAFFMAVYLRAYKKSHFRRAAVLEAAVFHRVYNRMALIAVAVAVAYTFGAWAIGALGGMLVLGYFSYRIRVNRHQRHFDITIEEVPVGAAD